MKLLHLLLLLLSIQVILHAQNDSQQKWIDNINDGNSGEWKKFYLDEAGIFVSGRLEKVKEYDGGHPIISAVVTKKFDAFDFVFKTEGRAGNIMSLGYLKSAEDLFGVLIAWRKKGEQYLKEFETIIKIEPHNINFDPEILNKQRRNWEKYSNAHDPGGLLENVYSSDSYYFNGGKIDLGRETITERYGYMKNQNWNIRLEAKGLIPVSEDVVLEIGKYYSTGEGQYLLIWEKQSTGAWQIKLDFNF